MEGSFTNSSLSPVADRPLRQSVYDRVATPAASCFFDSLQLVPERGKASSSSASSGCGGKAAGKECRLGSGLYPARPGRSMALLQDAEGL